jgi:beta-N-acetylhexosaminidase
MIAVDHEGGLVQRIRGGMSNLGPNWNVGQIRPLSAAIAAACERGRIHGQELAAVGIQMNLAPDLDVWDNPQNTVIGTRSYSGDPNVAAILGAAYVEALQGQGVIAVGKHFPGHGSSAEDSHLTLPVVWHDRAWLDTHELVPFRAAQQARVAGIMTAHISFPALDPVPDRPGSLSPIIVQQLLRNELHYDGLILTDDMGAMEAVTGRYEPGEAAISAIEAGSDQIIVVGPLWRQRRMAEALTAAIGNRVSSARLDKSVRRILRAKQQVGLFDGIVTIPNSASPVCD